MSIYHIYFLEALVLVIWVDFCQTKTLFGPLWSSPVISSNSVWLFPSPAWNHEFHRQYHFSLLTHDLRTSSASGETWGNYKSICFSKFFLYGYGSKPWDPSVPKQPIRLDVYRPPHWKWWVLINPYNFLKFPSLTRMTGPNSRHLTSRPRLHCQQDLTEALLLGMLYICAYIPIYAYGYCIVDVYISSVACSV